MCTFDHMREDDKGDGAWKRSRVDEDTQYSQYPEKRWNSDSSSFGLMIWSVLKVNAAGSALFRAASLTVPFVDPLRTLADPALPLTVNEWEEFGNPHDRFQGPRLSFKIELEGESAIIPSENDYNTPESFRASARHIHSIPTVALLDGLAFSRCWCPALQAQETLPSGDPRRRS